VSGRSAEAPVGGEVEAGFEPVREAFAANLARGRTLGSACTIYHQGRRVVHLWGGWRDQARSDPWSEDTIVLVYSVSKGLSALCCALAVSQGLFSYDEPIGAIWPEFTAHGKGDLTIGQVLSEQAGVAALDTRLTIANMADQDAMASAIERQSPNWRPARFAGNHSYTLGWLAGELIRRRDPGRRSLGRYFAEEVAGPLGADAWIGLPASIDRSRIARIKGFSLLDLFVRHTNMPWELVFALIWPFSLSFRTLNNPLFLSGPAALDEEKWRSIEIGACGGIASASALAAIYQSLAVGAKARLARHVLSELEAGITEPSAGLFDEVLKTNVRYSHGFEKPIPEWEFARTGSAFGAFAVGGSLAFADPEDEVAYAWVTNELGTYKWDDPREKSVRDAFYNCLSGRRGS
jgi:CubicO group peptidase (beta-lactamase class C family)